MTTTRLTRRTRDLTLTRLAEGLSIQLREDAPRATARLLDADDIDAGLTEHRAALRAVSPDDTTATTTIRGGFVASGYGYWGESDEVRVSTDIATGATTLTAERAPAQRRPRGEGALVISRLLRADQTTGRVVS
jgi:hypothetical protein